MKSKQISKIFIGIYIINFILAMAIYVTTKSWEKTPSDPSVILVAIRYVIIAITFLLAFYQILVGSKIIGSNYSSNHDRIGLFAGISGVATEIFAVIELTISHNAFISFIALIPLVAAFVLNIVNVAKK